MKYLCLILLFIAGCKNTYYTHKRHFLFSVEREKIVYKDSLIHSRKRFKIHLERKGGTDYKELKKPKSKP